MGAITGSTSLLTVPVMLLVGMDAKTAVATNMLGVLALSIGASVPYVKERRIPRRPTIGLALASAPGSIAGAFAAVAISENALRTTITIAMLAMAIVIVARPNFGDAAQPRSKIAHAAGYISMAAWGVYGGLFSGGYATVLTFACIACFGLSFVEAVGVTKLVNAVGSLAAVSVFAAEKRIDWRVGLAISVASLVGGWMGAAFAIKRGATVIRRLFAVVVFAFGARLLYGVIAR